MTKKNSDMHKTEENKAERGTGQQEMQPLVGAPDEQIAQHDLQHNNTEVNAIEEEQISADLDALAAFKIDLG